VSLLHKLRSPHIRHPDLDWTKPAGTEPLTMLGYPVSSLRHATMLHVTCRAVDSD
jgi:hypothetical protein